MLHHVFWPPNSTYRELLLHYVNTVREKYSNCHIVFDGYRKPSLKDHEHVRRTAKLKSIDINFTMDMKVLVKREDFLSNSTNKTQFISELTCMLWEDGQEVTVSELDADIDIVRVALEV